MYYTRIFLPFLLILGFSFALNAQDTTFLKQEGIYYVEANKTTKWGIYHPEPKTILTIAQYDTVGRYCCKKRTDLAMYRVEIRGENETIGGTFRKRDGKLEPLTGIALKNDHQMISQEGNNTFLMDGIFYTMGSNGKQQWGFYDPETKQPKGEERYDSLEYTYSYSAEVGYYKAKKDGKYGFFSQDQKVLIPIEYDEAYFNLRFSEYRIHTRKGNKWGVFDANGKVVLETKYDEILSDGYSFKVRIGEKYGLYDLAGKEEMPVCFDDIFYNVIVQRSLVKTNDKWSAYEWEQDGDPCKPEKKFDFVAYYQDWYLLKEGNAYGLADSKGDFILPLEYAVIEPFRAGLTNTLFVRRQGEKGVKGKCGVVRIDASGKVITEIPIEYDEVWVDENIGSIKVKQGKYVDYYGENGPFFDLQYNDVYCYRHRYYDKYAKQPVFVDFFTIKKGAKWGLAYASGEVLIEPQYNKIHVIDIKNFMVQKGSKWGIVDHGGKVKVPPLYDDFNYVPEWKAFFSFKNGKYGLVSVKRGVMLPAEYDEILVLDTKTFLVQYKGKWGIAVPGGRAVVPTEYTEYRFKKEGKEIWFIHDNGSIFKHRMGGGF